MHTAILWVILLAPVADSDLTADLREYFLAPDADAKLSMENRIVEREGLTSGQLAEAIRTVKLWEPQNPGAQAMQFDLGGDQHFLKSCWVSVPADYDHDRKWPLLIFYHGAGGNPRGALAWAARLVGHRKDEFVIVAPDAIGSVPPGVAGPEGYRGLSFTNPPISVDQPRRLVRALRRRFHIDSDRVYVMGYSLGASNTWMSLVLHADLFAAAIPLAHVLQIVGDTALYETLLPNARHAAVLFCWGENDIYNARGEVSGTGGIAGRSRVMATMIDRMRFDAFQHVEQPGAGHRDVQPPPDALGEILDRPRTRCPKRVRQAFRLADQSAAYWVSTDEFRGEAFPEGTLQIPVVDGEDFSVTTKKWLVGRIGFVEGVCKGQRLRVRGKKAGDIILMLSDDLVDLDQPVTIYRGKKKRFEGRIERDPRVMLREAAASWDFQRLRMARVGVPPRGRVQFGF